jgi:16S rRNA (guanine966-N2)-methyltransferase
VVSQLKQHLDTLQATGGEILHRDALQILATPPDVPFDIVFLDPPFNKGLITPCVEAMESNGWLSENARIYIEAESELQDLKLPKQWNIIRSQAAGQVNCYLAIRSSEEKEKK